MTNAVWDLVARKTGKPLYALFTDKKVEQVAAYASGINPVKPWETIEKCRRKGFSAFKLKIGFGHEVDVPNIERIVGQMLPDETLMLDANQKWSLTEAVTIVSGLKGLPIGWLEEPLPANRPAEEWAELASVCSFPLAAGENTRGVDGFERLISDGYVGVIQPDVCKWGGVSGCLRVARMALEAGERYCPHYLGGGIGLLTSAHVLAAAGGDGLLEVDANTNPLREGLAAPYPQITEGCFSIPDTPGLGVEPDFEAVRADLVETRTA
jgi:L-alanine-DL-glutamate epimerase-like enolase superfamily enzyme